MKKNLRLIFFLCATLFADITFAQTYNFKNFTVDDGLSQATIMSLYQDQLGYIWMGSNGGGVTKYDGSKFINFTEKDSLVNNVVFSIAQDPQGKMYFGTNGGLSVFDGHDFKNFTDKEGLPHFRVFKVFCDKDGLIWCGTSKGVCTFSNGKINLFEKDTTLSKVGVYSIYQDSKNNIWFATQSAGVAKYDGKKVKFYSVEQGLESKITWTIIEDKKGDIWVGTSGGINKICPNEKIEKILIIGMSVTNVVNGSIMDNKGELWFTTQLGIAATYDGTKFKIYQEKNGLVNNKMWSILQDRDGNYWFGSGVNGLSKFRNEAFIHFSIKDSLSMNEVISIFQDSKGIYWIGTDQGGVNKFNGNKFEIYKHIDKSKANDKIGASVTSIVEDANGTFWFASSSGGVSKFDGKNFVNYGRKDGLKNNTIRCLFVDKKQNVWAGTKDGVSKIVREKVDSTFDYDKHITKDNVWNIYEDKKGVMWFATEKGVVNYDGSSYHYYNEKDGFVDSRVRKITQDNSGNYWFATNKGVFKFDGKSFVNINEASGLSSNSIYVLLFDKSQNLWIGTNKGVDKLDIKVFNRLNKIKITHYGKNEGFTGIECNANAGFTDNRGRLWFGTHKGFTIIDPSLIALNKVEPKTNITNIRLSFENYDWIPYCDSINPQTHLPVNMVLPYNKNHLTFDFIGVSLTIPEKVKYQFKLEGFDDEWYPITKKNEAVYSNIPPGYYTFLVKSCNNDGVWNEKPTEFRFYIQPPFWKTWWFITLMVIFTAFAIYSFFRYRLKALEKQKQVLEDEVKARTAEIVQANEELEAQRDELEDKNHLIEEKNKDITDSINYAKRIQEAVLPAQALISNGFKESFILFRPKDIVSGDFYWYAYKEGKHFIAAVDCTGHGVPGAFMSMIGNNLLNEVIPKVNIDSPGDVLKGLNRGLKQAFSRSSIGGDTKDGMDVAMCMFNEKTNQLEYAGAQRPLYRIRKGELEEIKASKAPIGSITDVNFEYTNHTFEIEPGDTFYFTSDGYPDQFGGPDGRKYMTKRFKEVLISIQDKNLIEQHEILYNNIINWMGDTYEQIDDVLVIGLRF